MSFELLSQPACNTLKKAKNIHIQTALLGGVHFAKITKQEAKNQIAENPRRWQIHNMLHVNDSAFLIPRPALQKDYAAPDVENDPFLGDKVEAITP